MVSFVDAIIVAVISVHLFFSPFTKVEESFNIQAIHDHLTYGLDVSKYDHTVFPGAVPRTFIGSLFISSLLKPVQLLIEKDVTDIDLQILARGILGLLNAFGLILLKDSVVSQINLQGKSESEKEEKEETSKPSGWLVGVWFIVLQASQFHIIYYASRTLPNFIVLPLTNFALSRLIIGDYFTTISILSFSTVVFRIELLALTLSVGFVLFVSKKVSILTLVKSAVLGGLIGVALSGAVDSYFWQRPLVPELESFIYNVIEGKSENWGVEPIHAYLTKYLLLIFLPPTVLALQGTGTFNDYTGNNSLSILSASSFLYIAIISLQPHKEWRFIIYAVPALTVVSANGAAELTARAKKSWIYRALVSIIVGSTLVSFAISTVWLKASSMNYPGGEALEELNGILLNTHKLGKTSNQVTVHIDVPACMTGVTLFGEINASPEFTVIYDKTEEFQELQNKWDTFDFLLTDASDAISLPKIPGHEWFQLASIKGFAGINTGLVKSFNPDFILSLIDVTIRSRTLHPLINLFNLLFVQQDYLYIYTKVEMSSQQHDKIIQKLRNI